MKTNYPTLLEIAKKYKADPKAIKQIEDSAKRMKKEVDEFYAGLPFDKSPKKSWWKKWFSFL